MPLGRMNPTYSTSPLVCEYTGYVTFSTSGAPPANTVLNTLTKLSVASNANGATLGQLYSMSPDSRMPVVSYPTTVYHPAVAANTTAFMFMIDCRALNADIIYASAAYVPAPSATAGNLPTLASAANANVLGIDNVNKFVYFTLTSSSGSAVYPTPGSSVHFDIAFRDTQAI